jgi:hypothetical protein
MKEVSIKKMIIQLGDRDIELKMEEAKKLQAALNELFGKEVVKEIHHDRYRYPYWQWVYTAPNYTVTTPTWGTNTVSGNSITTTGSSFSLKDSSVYCSV